MSWKEILKADEYGYSPYNEEASLGTETSDYDTERFKEAGEEQFDEYDDAWSEEDEKAHQADSFWTDGQAQFEGEKFDSLMNNLRFFPENTQRHLDIWKEKGKDIPKLISRKKAELDKLIQKIPDLIEHWEDMVPSQRNTRRFYEDFMKEIMYDYNKDYRTFATNARNWANQNLR